ncbi:hypothetical protein [Bradyrhizobium sp.]|jgi:hypothetical protein|uniref:hypothetical protein n=1 Tax=Bradyrhizobium sp. TaxID=376 RepID=UPI002E073A3E|nr:hypothetical protein [Bradyrhizobium sp.]
MLKNPFVIYILSFGGVLAVYQLRWSEAYPALSSDLLAFFGLTFLVSILLAFAVSGVMRETGGYQPGRLPKYTVLLVLAGAAADLIYTGGIPLILVIAGKFDYAGEDLGVPHLHVFTVTFGSVFSTIRFSDYLYSKRLRYLAEALLPIVYFILIFYRGPVMICMVAWAFVIFIKRGRLGLLRGSLIVAFALLILHLFGVFGNLREGDESAIEKVGRPSQAFQESWIPKTYLWAYVYMTSPLANLQTAVDAPSLERRTLAEFAVSEMLPDFVSKRILPSLGAERVKTPEVSRGLNVATMFGRSYVYAGWIGPTLLFTLFAALIVVYLQLIRRSAYREPCLAQLNMFIVFCTFQNMIAFSGLILQLVWPLFLPTRQPAAPSDRVDGAGAFSRLQESSQ